MLTKHENDLLTRVEGDAPMGGILMNLARIARPRLFSRAMKNAVCAASIMAGSLMWTAIALICRLSRRKARCAKR